MREDLIDGAPEVPLAFLEQPAPDYPEGAAPPGYAYLQLSEGYAVEAEQARGLGWVVERLDGHHLSVLTDPSGVARTIIDLASRLPGRPHPSA